MPGSAPGLYEPVPGLADAIGLESASLTKQADRGRQERDDDRRGQAAESVSPSSAMRAARAIRRPPAAACQREVASLGAG